jgi:hypothetical protein
VKPPPGIELGSLMTGSKRVNHWTSGTVYECSEIAGSPHPCRKEFPFPQRSKNQAKRHVGVSPFPTKMLIFPPLHKRQNSLLTHPSFVHLFALLQLCLHVQLQFSLYFLSFFLFLSRFPAPTHIWLKFTKSPPTHFNMTPTAMFILCDKEFNLPKMKFPIVGG